MFILLRKIPKGGANLSLTVPSPSFFQSHLSHCFLFFSLEFCQVSGQGRIPRLFKVSTPSIRADPIIAPPQDHIRSLVTSLKMFQTDDAIFLLFFSKFGSLGCGTYWLTAIANKGVCNFSYTARNRRTNLLLKREKKETE